MPVLNNIGFLATCKEEGSQSDIHEIRNAAVVWQGEQIVWVGQEKHLPEEYFNDQMFDAGGRLVIPGLVDCHTHLVFGGWRAGEFSMRIKGKSYLEIAREGGGILSTVKETRNASKDALYNKAMALLKEIAELGVTAVECKSGYGLSLDDELKTLRVYRRLSENHPLEVIPTFLGAHTFPPEYKQDREGYLRLIIDEMIPAVAGEGLAEYCDIFVEDSAFTVDEARRVLTAASSAGLTPKLHADQLTSCGGAQLAAEMNAASADHLEKISADGIEAMAEAGIVAVTLPIASLYTQEQPLDCRKLIERGISVAVATDFNPGSAPSYDLPLAMMLACNRGRMTPSETLKGATFYAARAVGRENRMGSVEPGKDANLAIIDAPDPDFWMYHFRGARCLHSYVRGQELF